MRSRKPFLPRRCCHQGAVDSTPPKDCRRVATGSTRRVAAKPTMNRATAPNTRTAATAIRRLSVTAFPLYPDVHDFANPQETDDLQDQGGDQERLPRRILEESHHVVGRDDRDQEG